MIDTSNPIIPFIGPTVIFAGVVVAGIIRRSRRNAAHWRDVEARQRREREAANAPAFCQHCSALIPKTAGVVRFCQRCGQPPDGSALIVRGPAPGDEVPTFTPGKFVRLQPGWKIEQVEPTKPAREWPALSVLPCGCGGKFLYDLNRDVYRCNTCPQVLACAEAGERLALNAAYRATRG